MDECPARVTVPGVELSIQGGKMPASKTSMDARLMSSFTERYEEVRGNWAKEILWFDDARQCGMSWKGIGAILGLSGRGAKYRYDQLRSGRIRRYQRL